MRAVHTKGGQTRTNLHKCWLGGTELQTAGCEAYSFATDRYGVFNVRTALDACRTHEGGPDTNKSAQELTRRDREAVPNPAQQRDRIQDLRIIISTV